MNKRIWKQLLPFLMVLTLLCASVSFAMAEEAETPDLTLEKLIEMNGGDLEYATDENGNITFLRGKFCEEKVTDLSGVVRALGGVLLLLGGDENTAFSQAVGMQDDYGNCYYSLYQWSGDMAVQNAVVKIITDSEGNTIALSSSIVSGVADLQEAIIEPEAALELVKQFIAEVDPDTAYTFYEDSVEKAILSIYGSPVLAYIVYTNNPESSVESNDLAYVAHYVSGTGNYLYSMLVSQRGDELSKAGSDPLSTFEGMESDQFTGTVTLYDGSTREITVPVMKDTAGTYYLGDTQRHIAMADSWEFEHNDNHIVLSSSPDNTGWDNKQLMAYEGYIQAYDYYAAVGWRSCDGMGTPILLLANFVDADKKPVDNACYMGKIYGWQCFCATSELNNFCESLDAIGHEYTHGFTTASMTAIRYENQYGAINEAMSDIMGNIMEMLCGRTEDTTWLMGEMTGTPIRSMTDPNRFHQPAYVGGDYYVPDVDVPAQANDRGGVHLNNSLLSSVATKLWQSGMTLEELRSLWTTYICGLVPSSDYEDTCLMLPFAATLAGLDEYQDDIAKALSEIGLDNPDPFGTLEGDSALVTMDTPDGVDPATVQLALLYDDVNTRGIRTYPAAKTNKITFRLEPGSYRPRLRLYDLASSAMKVEYFFDGEKWTLDEAAEGRELVLSAGESYHFTCEGIEPLPVS